MKKTKGTKSKSNLSNPPKDPTTSKNQKLQILGVYLTMQNYI